MKVRYYTAVLVLAGLVCGTYQAAAIQLLDVLLLSDGTSVTGVIMEEEPGKSLVIETEDGQLLKYRLKDIERIEKKLVEEEALIENRDVVYLNDGVVFRGMIVGQDPGREITLELEDGQLLHFPMKEVFKITKEQVGTGIAKKAVLRPKKAEKERILITIQIMRNQLEAKKSSLKPGMDASAEQSLKEEAGRLEEEIAALEEEREAIAEEVEEEEQRFAQVEGELGELRGELLSASEEIEQRIAACSSPELRNQLKAKYAELQKDISEILQRAEVVALLEQQDPRITQIELEQKSSEALAITQNQLWNHPRYRDQLEQLVSELPLEERQRIYNESKQGKAGGAMALNLIPLLNLGSWRQKDYLGASIGTVATIGGAAFAGTIAFIATNIENRPTTDSEDVLIITGWSAALAGYVFGLIEPLFYVKRYNDRLAEAMDLSSIEKATARRQVASGDRRQVFSDALTAPTFAVTIVRYEY